MEIVKRYFIAVLFLVFTFSIQAQDGYWNEPEPLIELNTIDGEGYAFLSADGNILLWNAQGTICMSRWDGESWSPRELLPEPVNSNFLELAPAITPDHSHFYWVSWREGGYGGWDIWRCTWEESTNTFGEAECLSENINSWYDEFGVCFSPDGSRLFFVTDIPNKNGQQGYGDFDIWYCDWDSSVSDWGLPYNLGEPINWVGCDWTPFIAPRQDSAGYRLYFSSDHWHHLPGWQGLVDILFADWDGQSWTNFSNIGVPINSPVEDESACVTPDGQTLYFVTRRDRQEYVDMELMVSHWIPTSIPQEGLEYLPDNLLINSYPNPFNSATKIRLAGELSQVELIAIYDLGGRLVTALAPAPEITWDGANQAGDQVPSGIYFVRAAGQRKSAMVKVTLLR